MAKIQTKAYFDNDIKSQIIESLKTAKQEIFVASAWFNDEELYNALLALPRNIKTNILIKKDEETNKLDWKNLGDNNIGVYQLLEESGSRSLIHHKFCTIDNHTVITSLIGGVSIMLVFNEIYT
jgi:phosphatidylserine/phosphatidylglycerophosphate/cardiolipin synthase-like enzyme